MDRDEAARLLDGGEYRREGSRELFSSMKAAGLVAAFGASDDLIEMRGAVMDEFGMGPVPMSSAGPLTNDCSNADCPYFKLAAKHAPSIRRFYDRSTSCWRFETAIPHSIFRIMEDGDVFGEGVVFALSDVE